MALLQQLLDLIRDRLGHSTPEREPEVRDANGRLGQSDDGLRETFARSDP
ncbi:MAG: hypothetical protein M5U32_19185 [Myxococcota bacterium]|nr:hypothetical protein [Myxococcota bacterium]